MPEIDHELRIDATPKRVYAALATPDGVKGWHTPTASGTGEVGSEWVFSFADHPEFGWEITASDAGGTAARRVARHAQELPQVQHDVGRAPASPA
jgi:uncharacterized protein YndB with AHSA1/START domain